MADILNQLDGVESNKGCVRFFTCNDVDEIYKHDALINRMNGKFKFDYPTIDDFEKKLNILLTFWDDDWHKENKYKKIEFLSLLYDLNTISCRITLRPFTTYVIRYLFSIDCLEKMIENIGELYK